ncbi:Gypsy retrotransposon integrase-like protein 1 [Paramarasmius palmivorus]|uniref:Gypsy retrotransposon integrase-like protein 1 n=1 Tax=Paramarasmius palmivorus TaxID=297713 RepID=A0AAW0D2E0_9AGAR
MATKQNGNSVRQNGILTKQIGNAEAGPSKKRRLPGACDTCKKRKIRCDSGEKPNGQCTNCVNAGIECTHIELTKNLGSAKGYVEGLEIRLEKMEQLLKKLLPGVDISNELENDTPEAPREEEPTLPRNDIDEIEYKLEKLALEPPYRRYYGKGSGLYLVETALLHKEHHTGKEVPQVPMKHDDPRYWEPTSINALSETTPTYIFPDEDLIPELVGLYFKHVNTFWPLLHRPTFERSVAEREHLYDHLFGGVLMLVCGIGARWSSDTRVFSEGPEVPNSAGWFWVSQVPVVTIPRGKPTLYELQIYALAVHYFKSTSYTFSTWTMLGFALRMAQDVGAHSRRSTRAPNAQDELWKRAFFVLLASERTMGSFLGRAPIIHDDEYDVDLPIECDDEYWDCADPSQNFKQPTGKPSKMSFFIHLLKLSDILSYALRTVYSLRKPNSVTGVPLHVQSEQNLITDLDSAMNRWLDGVPDHLKWDPNLKEDLFFKQSALLYASYYQTQIFIHKPFIPTPHNPSSLSFPSLTICTTAARACSHIARALLARKAVVPFSYMQICIFSAAIVLLLNTWTGKRSGFTSNADRDSADVQVCMKLLQSYEYRWPDAGRLRDLMVDLAAVSEIPIFGQKRRRSADNLKEEADASNIATFGNNQNRVLAGSRRASVKANGSQYLSGPQYGLAPAPASYNSSPELLGYVGDFATPESTSSGSASGTSPSIPSTSTSFSLPELNGNYGAPAYAQQAELDKFLASLPAMNDAMSLWTSTPFGLEMQDWAPYLSSFNQANQASQSYLPPETDPPLSQQFWQ